MNQHDFLVEIGCEELPAKTLPRLINAFKTQVAQGLEQAKLTYDNIQLFATPRRLALLVEQLIEQQPDQAMERRGPAVQAAFDAQGNPSKAALGFAQSCQVEFSELQRLKTDKGEWLVHRFQQRGKAVTELLPDIIRQALKQLPIAKPMRWGNHQAEFARPVHWVVMLYNGTLMTDEVLGIHASHTTYGHRFHHPGAIHLTEPKHYPTTLKTIKVMADFAERRAFIKESIQALAKKHQAEVPINPELLDEVTGLVEWPVPLLANFDETFLQVPAECLIAAMQDHQKTFHLMRDGKLLPHFITISNIESQDAKRVIEGNQRVMRARLSDAAFFFNTDKKQRLQDRIERLKHVVFQKQLGTLFDKSQRVATLAAFIAGQLDGDQALAKRAGELSKCDLVTDMVGEFPELQGIMGYYYARQDGEPELVAQALKEQYYPRFAGDQLPTTLISNALALAERFDTLMGIFAIGQKPTGEKDPFKCRRGALGIVRILIENQCHLDMNAVLQQALAQYPNLPAEGVIESVQQFILERLNGYYQEQHISQDIIAAVLERQQNDLADFDVRVQAVNQFLQLNEARSLAAANKRVSKLLIKEGKTDLANGVDQALLSDQAEIELADLIEQQKSSLESLYQSGQYSQVLSQLATLQQPIDRFFDQVMVMVDDQKIRDNRLALLAGLRRLFLHVADISLLQSKDAE